MFRLFFLFFSLSLSLFAKEPIELIFSHNAKVESPKGKASLYFKKRVEELTKGRVVVKIYANSELYKDSNVLSALKIDKVHIACPSFSKFLKELPILNIFELPFLFENLTHVYKVMNSEVGEEISRRAFEKGYVVLNFWDKGFKQFTSSKKAIIYPSDLYKQKIRIRGLRVLNIIFRAFKAYPKVLAYRRVYSKLKSKEIDAEENTITEIYRMRFYKEQKYLTISNHGYLGYMVVMSKRFWLTLPKDIQEALFIAMKEATLKERLYAKNEEIIDLKRIKNFAKFGTLSIIEGLTDKQRDKWLVESKKLIYPLFYDKDSIGKKYIDKVLELR